MPAAVTNFSAATSQFSKETMQKTATDLWFALHANQDTQLQSFQSPYCSSTGTGSSTGSSTSESESRQQGSVAQSSSLH